MAASEKRRRRGGSARQRSWQQRRGLGPPRDFLGYGADPPQVRWPGNARIAINSNLNVEAGGEHSILEGDPQSENLLTDIGFPAYAGKRSPMVESAFEYGPRVGCWRLLRIFKRFDVKASILGVVRGLQMYPELTRAFVEEGHEMVSHGWRWIDYHTMGEKEEREHIQLAVAGIKKLIGQPPGRLVRRPPEHQHPAPAGGARRLSLRPRLSRRRIAVLDTVRHAKPSGDPLLARNQRQPLRLQLRLQYRRRVRAVYDRLLRPALRGGSRTAEDHERCAARPADCSAGPRGRADQVPRLCVRARQDLVLHRARHCRALAPRAPTARIAARPSSIAHGVPRRASPNPRRRCSANFSARDNGGNVEIVGPTVPNGAASSRGRPSRSAVSICPASSTRSKLLHFRFVHADHGTTQASNGDFNRAFADNHDVAATKPESDATAARQRNDAKCHHRHFAPRKSSEFFAVQPP